MKDFLYLQRTYVAEFLNFSIIPSRVLGFAGNIDIVDFKEFLHRFKPIFEIVMIDICAKMDYLDVSGNALCIKCCYADINYKNSNLRAKRCKICMKFTM